MDALNNTFMEPGMTTNNVAEYTMGSNSKMSVNYINALP